MGVKNGFGKEKFKNGDSFEGHYLNGKFEGTGIIISIFRNLSVDKWLKI
jgi:hypothetical protein